MAIFNRLPKPKEIAPVYAVIVIMVYGWTIFKFSYYASGWLYFLTLNEVLGVFAYSMVVNLLESLIVLIGILAIGFALPKNWFLDSFITRGVIFSALLLGLMMYVADQFSAKDYYPADLIRWASVIFALAGLAVYFLGRIRLVRRAVEFFADRAIVFLYISLPVSLLSLIAVFLQNIF